MVVGSHIHFPFCRGPLNRSLAPISKTILLVRFTSIAYHGHYISIRYVTSRSLWSPDGHLFGWPYKAA